MNDISEITVGLDFMTKKIFCDSQEFKRYSKIKKNYPIVRNFG